MVSAGYGGRVLVWNLDTRKVEISLEPLSEPVSYNINCPGNQTAELTWNHIASFHSYQLFAMAWSPDGKSLATLGKDHTIRIYDPRSSTHPLREGAGPSGSRGARLVWLNNEHLVASGFNR